ncbi:YkgB family protein [Rhodovibrionaceae bacterium A322]
MTTQTSNLKAAPLPFSQQLTQSRADTFVRLSMVALFLIFGLHKFTAYEANAIAGLAVNSPLLSGPHALLGVRGFSNLIGLVEVSAALLVLAGFYRNRLGLFGGLLMTGTFLITLSFVLSTPGVFEASAGGFPFLSVMPGQFLIKDLVLLAVSVWLVARHLKTS